MSIRRSVGRKSKNKKLMGRAVRTHSLSQLKFEDKLKQYLIDEIKHEIDEEDVNRDSSDKFAEKGKTKKTPKTDEILETFKRERLTPKTLELWEETNLAEEIRQVFHGTTLETASMIIDSGTIQERNGGLYVHDELGYGEVSFEINIDEDNWQSYDLRLDIDPFTETGIREYAHEQGARSFMFTHDIEIDVEDVIVHYDGKEYTVDKFKEFLEEEGFL